MYEAIVRQDSDDFLKREFIQAVKQDAEVCSNMYEYFQLVAITFI